MTSIFNKLINQTAPFSCSRIPETKIGDKWMFL